MHDACGERSLSMTDLLQSARLFEVSTRLQSASSCLLRSAENNELSDHGKESLEWAGILLTNMDWSSGISSSTSVEGGLSFSATDTRPKFYASLMKIAPDFMAIGIDTEDKLYQFLSKLYKFLAQKEKQISLNKEELKVAGKLLQVLSESIIVELSNNGLPKEHTDLTVGAFS